MLTDTVKSAIESAAISHATQLVAAAKATIARGQRVFVKGKPVMTPWSPEKITELRRLQIDAFEPYVLASQKRAFDAAEPLLSTDNSTDVEALEAEIKAAYCAAGRAEVARIW
jgi:hypothetical protein